MLGFLIAAISGLCMSVQGVFNTQVTKVSGIWTANIFVQATALAVCLGVWLVTERNSLMEVFKVEPKYMLLGGAIGAVITYTVIRSVSLLGPSKAVMVIVVVQILSAYLIELLGLFGMEKQEFHFTRILGVALAIGGILLFKWK